eukprot:2371782-Pyramimonas_sp.AAC.1
MDFLVVDAAARRVEEMGGRRQVRMPPATAVQASTSRDPQEVEKRRPGGLGGEGTKIDVHLCLKDCE